MLRTVPVWLLGSEGQSIQVNAFLDDGLDSTYVRDDIVTALGLETDEQNLRLTTLTDSCIPLKSKPLTIKSLNGETQSTVEAWKLEANETEDCPGWYLPHFPVIREDRETTKVRIVFDSAARCRETSLNDEMLTGPKLQQDVLKIRLRFRRKPVALVADIKEISLKLSSLRKIASITDGYGEIWIPQSLWMSMRQSV